jgi:NTE family protein
MTDLSTQASATTALALSGGVNLGATHAGALQGLLKAGIEPDLVVGSSVGALNGGCLAGSPTLEGVRALAELRAGRRRHDVFPFRGSQSMARFKGRKNHFFDAPRFASFLGRLSIGFDRLKDSPIPLHVVMTDLATGSPVVLSTGDVISDVPLNGQCGAKK